MEFDQNVLNNLTKRFDDLTTQLELQKTKCEDTTKLFTELDNELNNLTQKYSTHYLETMWGLYQTKMGDQNSFVNCIS